MKAVSGFFDQWRAWVRAEEKAGLGCGMNCHLLSEGRDQALGVLTFLEPNTEFGALHPAGA